MAYQKNFSAVVSVCGSMASLTLPFFLLAFSLVPPPSSTLLYHRPKTVSLLTNGIHSIQRESHIKQTNIELENKQQCF